MSENLKENGVMKRLSIQSCLAAGALVAGIVAAGNAQAAVVISSSTVGGSAFAGANYENFDGLPLGTAGGSNANGSISFTGNATDTGKVVVGDVSGQYAAPALSGLNNQFFGPLYTGDDTTKYISSGKTPTGSAVIQFTANQNYFGILWGSIDTENVLQFFNGSTLVGSFTGTDVGLPIPPGNQNPPGTRYVNFTTTAGTTFNRVVATSSIFTFEFDNVAFGNIAAVPEPTTVVPALLGVGLLYLRHRRKKAVVA
jgi:hypothetical protein